MTFGKQPRLFRNLLLVFKLTTLSSGDSLWRRWRFDELGQRRHCHFLPSRLPRPVAAGR